MKCLIIECEKEAKEGFATCSIWHGADLKRRRNDLNHCWNAKENANFYSLRPNYTLEDALTYIL